MKIPRYDAQVPLTKQAPGVMVDASAYGQQARAMGDIGNVITQIGQKLNEVQIDAQVDQAKILGTQLFNQAELDASQEQWTPDYDTNNQKRIDNIRQQVTASVKNPVALQQVNQWLDLNLSNSEMKMRQYGYAKLSEIRKDQKDNLLYDNEQKILNAPDAMKSVYLMERKKIYSDAVSGGVMTKSDADLNMKKDLVELVKKQAEWDIYNDNSTDESSPILAKLKNKSQYKGLTEDVRLSLVKESTQRIYYNNQKYKREVTDSQQNKIDDLTNKFIDGQLTYQDLENERNIPQEQGGLKPSKIESFKNDLNKQVEYNLKVITSNSAKASDYVDFFGKYIDNKTDREKAMELVSRAYADGLLSREEARQLTQLKSYAADVKWQRQADSAIWGMRQFYEWMGRRSKDDKDAAMKIKNYLNGLQGSDNMEKSSIDLMEAAIRQKRLEEHTWMTKLPIEGQEGYIDGVKVKVYPDGRVENIR